MSELEHYLKAIKGSAGSLDTLYFRPPGIFTNALICKPEITSLLRDADAHENALYHIDHQGKPERKDGTRGVVDILNEELDANEVLQQQQHQQQQLDEEEGRTQQNLPTRSAVVPIPLDAEPVTVDTNKGVKNLLSRFNEETQENNVDVLCETVRQLLEKYPIKGVSEELQLYEKQWVKLNTEIMENEETIENQRRQLSSFNVSLNDPEGQSQDTEQPQPKRKRTAADLIEEEEEELRQLELELQRKTRENEALLQASKR